MNMNCGLWTIVWWSVDKIVLGLEPKLQTDQSYANPGQNANTFIKNSIQHFCLVFSPEKIQTKKQEQQTNPWFWFIPISWSSSIIQQTEIHCEIEFSKSSFLHADKRDQKEKRNLPDWSSDAVAQVMNSSSFSFFDLPCFHLLLLFLLCSFCACELLFFVRE